MGGVKGGFGEAFGRLWRPLGGFGRRNGKCAGSLFTTRVYSGMLGKLVLSRPAPPRGGGGPQGPRAFRRAAPKKSAGHRPGPLFDLQNRFQNFTRFLIAFWLPKWCQKPPKMMPKFIKNARCVFIPFFLQFWKVFWSLFQAPDP